MIWQGWLDSRALDTDNSLAKATSLVFDINIHFIHPDEQTMLVHNFVYVTFLLIFFVNIFIAIDVVRRFVNHELATFRTYC